MSAKNQEIDDQAVEWAARKCLGTLTPQEQADLEAWLGADIRHLGAYAKAQAINARLERMRGISVFRPVPRQSVTRWSRRSWILSGSVAASLVAASVLGLNLWQDGRLETFTTGVGQRRTVWLSDGSVVTLNTDSMVEVRYTDKSRNVRLLRGEALFDVAKNIARPFVVVAGGTQVRAVGTSFTVSALPEHPIQVLVREGIVEMKRVGAVVSEPVRVSANIRAVAPADSPIMTTAISQSTLTRDLAWQHGYIAFDKQTLQDAAEEFARYSNVHIVVEPSVSSRTVTGYFASNDPVGFAKAVAVLLSLQVDVGEREVRLSGRPEISP